MLAAADSAPQRETDQELLCAGCGYPLRGLPDDGRCPECAFFVFRSRLIRERSGLSVEQRLRIRRSLLLVALSILTFLACVVAFIVAAVASAPRFIESAVGLLLLARAGLGVTGVFMATATTAGPAPPPSGGGFPRALQGTRQTGRPWRWWGPAGRRVTARNKRAAWPRDWPAQGWRL